MDLEKEKLICEKSTDYSVERIAHEELMKSFGKSRELTLEQLDHVQEIVGYLNDQQIAEYLGIEYGDFRRRLRTDEILRNAYQTGKARYIIESARVVMGKVQNNDLNAAMFYLKTKGGWKETQALEHAVVEPKKLSDFYE